MQTAKGTIALTTINIIVFLLFIVFLSDCINLSVKKYVPQLTLLKNTKPTSAIITTTASTTTSTSQIKRQKYIFNFDQWRWIYGYHPAHSNHTLCDVPEQVRPIADAFCHNALRRSCPQLPCSYVKLLPEDTKQIKVFSDGRRYGPASNYSRPIECLKSPALELFMHGHPYPSFTSNGFVRSSKRLLADVLSHSFRSPDSVWSFVFNHESISYYPFYGDKSIIGLFDITLGYDRTRYQIIKPQYLPLYVPSLTNQSRLSFESVMQMKQSPPAFVTAPIYWVNSNCRPKSNRTRHMQDLMTHIGVDSWGKCLRNKGPHLPPEIAKIHGSSTNKRHYKGNWIDSKIAMSQRYLFTIAMENSNTYDYVTEKLWQPLAAGSVPIYSGAPNIDDWLPCHHCIIDVRKFPSARALADYLKVLEKNMTLYGEYHQWRNEPVRESFLRLLNYFDRASAYSVDSVTCAMAHSEQPRLTRYRILETIGPVFTKVD